ncbi:sugar ABC transporter permease [Sporanaerobium hydrogeniformans]|uniref:Sugar ABC transporter permease n=1 Tax=Sporanaerobium hydrogeniformans TaxID=3072179 RepID=A0AC61D9B9_9FIRM|nr:substrate-binding domain-containing protein [Sporanaerobium hydrogeniformans]PHV69341.1 sugar ABC transporter permease [Sporanaerobium hydrogeniformans]
MRKTRIMATFLVATLTIAMMVGLTGCGSSGSKKGKTIAVMVPSADHGWTGAVLTYAQQKAEMLNADKDLSEKYSVKVYAAKDVEDQIQQVDDLLTKTNSLAGIVILPYDNGLQSTLEKIATANVPFVQFDRVINSDIIDKNVVANVKGDNEGIGYETAKRFIADGLSKNDYVYEMIGDNSSVPELRSKGFRTYLQEQGWSEDEINKVVVKSAATGWSRDKGKELFESWFGSSQCDPSKKNWIYTHDDEIAMGILESLNGAALDATKKETFMGQFKALSASSGLAEMYAVLKDKHKTIAYPTTYDLFSVTYDPAMIQEAMQVMMDFLNGDTSIDQNYVIPVSVVDKDNVGDFKAFGSYEEK